MKNRSNVNLSQNERYALAETIGEAFGFEGDHPHFHERASKKLQERLKDLTKPTRRAA